jgi:hypothetical protein
MKKKLSNMFGTIGVILAVAVGCATIAVLTPAQITTIGTVITQVSNQGAIYAIQQDSRNATYFKAANSVLDNFANGTDLTPSAFQAALANVPASTNQWVSLAITATITAYDISYSQYISGQVSNIPAAKIWILDVEEGFKQALASTGTGLKIAKATPPDFIKDGKVVKSTIKAKVKAAGKTA